MELHEELSYSMKLEVGLANWAQHEAMRLGRRAANFYLMTRHMVMERGL